MLYVYHIFTENQLAEFRSGKLYNALGLCWKMLEGRTMKFEASSMNFLDTF